MKKILFFIIVLIFYEFSFAQTINRQLISSSGKISNGGTITASSSTGQIISSTFINSNIKIIQGFQQGHWTDPGGISDKDGKFVNLTAYPNPVTTSIVLDFNNTREEKFEIAIYNVTGQKICGDIETTKNPYYKKELDFSGFSAGIYLVVLTDESGNYNSLKVQKINR
jgi:hypothetical protein